MAADLKGDDPTVIQIQNGTQVYFMDLGAGVILELCHIRQPFLVRSSCMKIPVQIIPCDVCGIIAAPGTTLRLPLYSRLNVIFTT